MLEVETEGVVEIEGFRLGDRRWRGERLYPDSWMTQLIQRGGF